MSIAKRVADKLAGDPTDIFMTPEEAAYLIDSDPDGEMAIAFYEAIGRRMTGKEVVKFFEDLEND